MPYVGKRSWMPAAATRRKPSGPGPGAAVNSQKVLEWFRRALEDPGFHRERFVLGHALPGEKRGRLLAPQERAIRAIEEVVARRKGGVVVIRSARQTMKNDVDAAVLCRLLHLYRLQGGSIVRTAPSFSPQLVNSRRRLDWMIQRDALFDASGPPVWRYGHLLEHGKAELILLSGARGGTQEGATASLLLSVDEAHRFDRGVFDDRFAPMTAFANAPTVLYGVAADRGDLLYEHLVHNLRDAGVADPEQPGGRVLEAPGVLQYPAEVWCDLLPTYRAHVDLRERRLGADHPTMMTNYWLTDIEAIGALFSGAHRRLLLEAEGARGRAAPGEREFVALIDLAGEVEHAAEVDPDYGDPEAPADACVVWIVAVNRGKTKFGWPVCRLVDVAWWVGLPIEGPGGIEERISGLLASWRPSNIVVDARGVGYGVARWLGRRWPGQVVEYASTAATKSEDLYALLALLNAGALEGFKGDSSPEWQQWEREVRGVRRRIAGHALLDLVAPARRPGDPPARDDMTRALSYLPRAVSGAASGHFLERYIAGNDDPLAPSLEAQGEMEAPAWLRET